MELETVWTGNNFDNSIISNVDKQDGPLFDDLKDLNSTDAGFGDVLGNFSKNLLYSNGITSGATRLFTQDEDKKTEVPKGTLRDNKFDEWLVKAKSKNFKNVKMTSKIGTFAGINDLINVCCGFMVGALGKSSTANFIDEMAIKFAGGVDSKALQFTAGLGLAGIAERLSYDNLHEKFPTLEEIAQLTLANYYNIYENRPGRIVRDRYNKYNYVTLNTEDGIDGSKNSKNEDGTFMKFLKGAGNSVSATMKTINKFGISMTKITDLLASSKPKGFDEEFDKESQKKNALIISNQKSNFETYIGEKLLEYNKIPLNSGKSPWEWANSKQGQARIKNADVYNRVNQHFRQIGCLYIEPYWNDGAVDCFKIPFQFNPRISGDSLEAKYNTEELMGRLLSIRSYIGSDSGTVSIEAEYLALASDTDLNDNTYGKERENKTYETYKENKEDKNVSYEDRPLKTDQWLHGWMTDWTVNKLEMIERAYRSLVYPYIDSEKSIFTKPPIVRIKLGAEGEGVDGKTSIEYVGDLFKYPIDNKTNAIQVTKNLDSFTREKRYIVTNVEIAPLNDESWGLNYYVKMDQNSSNNEKKGYRRNGFRVNLSLAETTKNFLDIVPSFKQYYEYSGGGSSVKEGSKPSSFTPNPDKGTGVDSTDSLVSELTEIDFKERKVSKTVRNKEWNKEKKDLIVEEEAANFFATIFKYKSSKDLLKDDTGEA